MTPPRTRKGPAAKKAAAKRSAEPPVDTQPSGELPEEVVEVRTGLISGSTFTDVPVQYVESGGFAIFEGDIILGRAADLEAGLAASSERSKDATVGLHTGIKPGTRVDDVSVPTGAEPQSAVIIPGATRRWPAGRVPFEVAANLTPAARANLTAAVAHWHDRTRMSFRARQSSDPSWLTCMDSTGCSSWVGRQGGGQDVNLAAGCGTGATVHELGHAVGLWHEQSREDRDQFVQVHWANIEPAQKHNFDQHITDGDDVGGYDYGSIMHYGATAFGMTGPDGRKLVTLTPTRPLPPGVIIGQRAGLSIGDRAAVATMYPSIYPNSWNSWVGRFTGAPGAELLYYSPAQQMWYLGTTAAGALTFTPVGDTAGFGNLDDGRPFWTGDFTGNGSTDILFYYPGDDNWWLGQLVNGQLAWSLAGNTVGFGHNIFDGRPFWTGDFTGNGSTDILFYYPGDDNWWLGELTNGQLNWSHAGNTAGFGHNIFDGRPFWTGDFTGNGSTDILFYYPGDDNWWLGQLVNGQLVWSLAGNTVGFGHNIFDGRPFWTGDFTGNGATDILFYYPGDDNWWLGEIANGQLTWSSVGNTAGFGHGINDGRPFWTGDFTGNGSTDILFYYPGDDNWWLGEIVNGQLTWSHAGNTAGFGHGINDGRPFWIGDFTGNGQAEVVFHFRGDLNWWRGEVSGGSLGWSLAGNW